MQRTKKFYISYKTDDKCYIEKDETIVLGVDTYLLLSIRVSHRSLRSVLVSVFLRSLPGGCSR